MTLEGRRWCHQYSGVVGPTLPHPRAWKRYAPGQLQFDATACVHTLYYSSAPCARRVFLSSASLRISGTEAPCQPQDVTLPGQPAYQPACAVLSARAQLSLVRSGHVCRLGKYDRSVAAYQTIVPCKISRVYSATVGHPSEMSIQIFIHHPPAVRESDLSSSSSFFFFFVVTFASRKSLPGVLRQSTCPRGIDEAGLQVPRPPPPGGPPLPPRICHII